MSIDEKKRFFIALLKGSARLVAIFKFTSCRATSLTGTGAVVNGAGKPSAD